MKKHTLTLLISLVLVACSPADNSETKATNADVTPVSVAQVTPHTEAGNHYTATLMPRFQTPLGFRIAGEIARRHVEAGDKVTAGQALARLDSEDIRQRLKAAKTTLSAAQKNLTKAKNDWQRGQQLFDSGAIGDEQLEQYRVMLESARDQQQQARSQLNQAENALGYTELKAPLDGVVVSIQAQPGLVVSAGQPVVELAQGSDLQVVVDLPEQVTAAKTAQLQLAEKTYPLQLFSASGALDPQTFTRRTRYSVTQTPEQFTYGQLVQIQLPVDTEKTGDETLQVPVSAVDERGDKPQVWVVREQQAEALQITMVAINHEHAILQSSQLEVGDRVIAHGINRLKNGQKVRVVE